MAKAIKPTKQQIAQGKARAGGNNPINVTNAGLKKLGSAALIAASFTPAGRAVKVAATAAKAAKATKTVKAVAKVEKRALKAANKPTNKTGSKADRADRKTFQGQSNMIKNADPLRANRTRGGSLSSIKTYGGVGDVAKAARKSSPKSAQNQAELSKELNPVRKVKPTIKKK